MDFYNEKNNVWYTSFSNKLSNIVILPGHQHECDVKDLPLES